MTYLLDTHVLLWLATAPERLGSALDRLEAPDAELMVSAASAWELAIKSTIGRIALPLPVTEWFGNQLRVMGLSHLPVTWQDAGEVATLPLHHRDPFDRILVAQARRHGLVLVTADDALTAYDVSVLRVGSRRRRAR